MEMSTRYITESVIHGLCVKLKDHQGLEVASYRRLVHQKVKYFKLTIHVERYTKI